MGWESGTYDPSKVRSTDWQKEILRVGLTQNHQISITTATDKSSFLISGNYYNEEGVVKNENYERYSLRINADHRVFKFMKVGGSTMFVNSIQEKGSGAYGNTIVLNPLAPVYSEPGVLSEFIGSDPQQYNTIFDINNSLNETRIYQFFGSTFLEAEIYKGLKYRMNFGIDFASQRDGNFRGSKTYDRKGGLSAVSNNHNELISYTLENLLYYDKTFRNNHKLGVTLLQSIQRTRSEGLGVEVRDLPYEHQLFYNLGTASIIDSRSSGLSESSMVSFMGRINYNYKDRYLLTLTERIDGASVLSEGNKYQSFPSAALAWRVSEEAFMKNIRFVDEFKFRVGYGVTGNSSVNPYQTLGGLGQTVYVFGETPFYGYEPSVIRNPELRWEKTKQFNIGVDLGFVNNRVRLTSDIYLQNTSDLILPQKLPNASGFDKIVMNIGSTRNKGIEIGLSTVNIQSAGGFTWTTGLTFAANKEEITKLWSGVTEDIGSRWFVGSPINTYYDWVFDGIWQKGQEEEMKKFNDNGGDFEPGEIRLKDITPDDKITDADRQILGSNVPKWSGGLSNTWSYKGIDLSVFIFTRQGNMIRQSVSMDLDGRYNIVDIPFWTPDNQNNKYPRAEFQKKPQYANVLEYVDGSFVRLKYISLAYSLPQTIVSKIFMKELRLSATLNNPFLWTSSDFLGLDPEGAAGRNTPSCTSLIFGLNVVF